MAHGHGQHGHLNYNALLIGAGAGAPLRSMDAALTDGQIVIGKTGYVPVPGTITGGGGIAVTGGAGTLALTTRGYASASGVGNVLTGEDDLMSWTMPAATLSTSGHGVHVGTLLGLANTVNVKTVKFYLGDQSVTLNPVTAAPTNVNMVADFWVWYLTSTSAYMAGTVHVGALLEQVIAVTLTGGTINFTAACVAKFTGTATATNDIFQSAVAMLAFRSP